MRIAVYTICKDEEQNILDWYDSMKEADEIYVLDTGSKDKSLELLKQCPKIKFKQHIFKPFRFDHARNMSLDMVPQEVELCVCTDLDERFEKGWRKKVEDNWEKDLTQAGYDYIYNFNADGTPGLTYELSKIHIRKGYSWAHQVHETLVYDGTIKSKKLPIVLTQYQDTRKDRSQYFEILKRSVEENPNDSRDLYCLGREYKNRKMYKECIDIFHKYLRLETSTWNEERSVVMRYMGLCYAGLKYNEEAVLWYKKSIKERPGIREPLYDLGVFYTNIKKFKEGAYYLKKALNISSRNPGYMNETYAWNGSIYDYLSYDEIMIGEYRDAYKHGLIAEKSFPNDQRIKDNNKKLRELIYENNTSQL